MSKDESTDKIRDLAKRIVDKQKTKRCLAVDAESAESGIFRIEDFSMTPEEAVAYLDGYVIKQAEPKWTLATHLIGHLNRIRFEIQQGLNPMDYDVGVKSNILLIGPTGVGKTFLVKLIARKIGAPFAKFDATKFSETGYVGGKVDSMVKGLYQKAMEIVAASPKSKELDQDKQEHEAIKLAQYGIIFVDEIDKIAKPRFGAGLDVSRGGVQRNLLSLIEERDVPLYDMQDPATISKFIAYSQANGGKTPEQKYINTKNIIFVFSGVFQGLSEIIAHRTSEKAIGFGQKIDKPDYSKVMSKLRAEDLESFGLESELVGRIPVRAIYQELTEDDLYEVLTLPNSVILKSFLRTMQSYGISVRISDKVFRTIASLAHREKTGARGLVSAFNDVLEVFLGRLPSTGITSLEITEEIVEMSKNEQMSLLEELAKGIEGAKNLPPYSTGAEHYLNEFFKIIGLRIVLPESEIVKACDVASARNITPYESVQEYFSPWIENFRYLCQHGLKKIDIKEIENMEKSVKAGILENIGELKFENGSGLGAAKKEVSINLNMDIKISKEAIGEIYFRAMILKKSPFIVFRDIFFTFASGLKMYKEMIGREFSVNTEFLADPKAYLTALILIKQKEEKMKQAIT